MKNDAYCSPEEMEKKKKPKRIGEGPLPNIPRESDGKQPKFNRIKKLIKGK